MIDFHFRCSSLGDIMTDPISVDERLVTEEVAAVLKKKVRTDDEKALIQGLKDRSLSAGAKTYIKKIAKEFVYGYNEVISGKYMEKGLRVEDDSIALYNAVHFTNYTKNTERRTNEWITGECDIYIPNVKIVDIKSSWSWPTFPSLAEDGEDKTYEWQGRGYMMLWNVNLFDIAYSMVETPEDLIKYEDPTLHEVHQIEDIRLRLTTVSYERDMVLEEKIKTKVTAARKYLAEVVSRIEQEHTY